MHRQKENAKTAGTRSAYFFPNVGWLRLCCCRVYQKTTKMCSKNLKNRHFKSSHCATLQPGDTAEKYTRWSAKAERPRCRVRYSFRQK